MSNAWLAVFTDSPWNWMRPCQEKQGHFGPLRFARVYQKRPQGKNGYLEKSSECDRCGIPTYDDMGKQQDEELASTTDLRYPLGAFSLNVHYLAGDVMWYVQRTVPGSSLEFKHRKVSQNPCNKAAS